MRPFFVLNALKEEHSSLSVLRTKNGLIYHPHFVKLSSCVIKFIPTFCKVGTNSKIDFTCTKAVDFSLYMPSKGL